MKGRNLFMLLAIPAMLIGCEDCEGIGETKVFEASCRINGKEFRDKVIHHILSPYVETVFWPCYFDDKEFLFSFQSNLTDDTGKRYLMEMVFVMQGYPETGKKYPLVNLRDIEPLELMEGCWFKIFDFSYFHELCDTLLLPAEVRSKQALIRIDRSRGHIIFSELDVQRSGVEFTGFVKGTFELEAQGENSCYPEATTSLDITDGKFACRVYSYGSHLRSGFPDFYPSCVYEPQQIE